MRPRAQKAEQIFQAAQEIFLEVGYGAASMDSVAFRAGVSKATIYAHYENKRALFEAVIRQRAESIAAGFTIPERVTDLKQTLSAIASSFFDMILTTEAVAMFRVVLAEVVHQPDVGEAFYNAGPTYARRCLADFLSRLADHGILRIDRQQVHTASDLFLSMLANDAHMRALFGQPADRALRERSVAMAVDLLIARFGRKDSIALESQ